MGRDGDVWMSKYETYSEKKWLERYDLWEDSIYLRGTHSRVKDKQGRENRGSEGFRVSHLKDINMNWSLHLWYALTLAGKLLLLSLTAVVHGLLPFIFTSKVSDGVASLDSELNK